MAEVIIYTVAGSLSSLFVGSLLGLLGKWVSAIGFGEFGLWFALAIALLAIVRELGWVSYPIPQLKRQTKDLWARIFPRKIAAMLWGLDLGLTFSTRITFSGVWVLVIVTILIGKPAFGAALFVLYWLGRALSLWIAPLLMPDSSSTDWVLEGIYRQYSLFRRIHVFGLVITVIILSTWLAHGIIT